MCPNGPPPIPLLPVPAIWRLVHWHGRLSLDTQRKKKPTINYRSWERVGGHIFLKHTNAKAERATYWAVSLFWGKGLCIHLLAPLDVPKHTQKRIEFNPFFSLLPYIRPPVSCTINRAFYSDQIQKTDRRNQFQTIVVVKRTCVPGAPYTPIFTIP